MTAVKLLACAAVVAGCGNKPSKAAVDAYRSAQKAALERLRTWEKDFASAMVDVKDGKWVPRPDLGACTTTVPKPLSDTDDGVGYPAFFVRDDGWDSFTSRVFNQAELEAGSPDRPAPDSDRIVEETKRLEGFVPFTTDVLVLEVDHEVKAKHGAGDSFEPGSQSGRAWVWTSTTHKISCAGEFAATTPSEVTATIYDGEDPDNEKDIQLTLALGRMSERSAMSHLIAAGPPRSP
jgi:hypothetical protein